VGAGHESGRCPPSHSPQGDEKDYVSTASTQKTKISISLAITFNIFQLYQIKKAKYCIFNINTIIPKLKYGWQACRCSFQIPVLG